LCDVIAVHGIFGLFLCEKFGRKAPKVDLFVDLVELN